MYLWIYVWFSCILSISSRNKHQSEIAKHMLSCIHDYLDLQNPVLSKNHTLLMLFLLIYRLPLTPFLLFWLVWSCQDPPATVYIPVYWDNKHPFLWSSPSLFSLAKSMPQVEEVWDMGKIHDTGDGFCNSYQINTSTAWSILVLLELRRLTLPHVIRTWFTQTACTFGHN